MAEKEIWKKHILKRIKLIRLAGELFSGKEKRFAETNSADRSKKIFKNA